MSRFTKVAAIAALCAGMAWTQKQYRPGEYDSYNAVVKDIQSNQFAQAITDLDAWKSKVPQSDYAADRDVLYMKSYVGAKQWAQAVDKAGEVAGHSFDPSQELQVLYNATISIAQIANPSDQEVATGKAAAGKLMAFDRRPDGVSDADWAKLRADVQAPARAALQYLAILPGNQAMTKQPRDCAAAVVAYTKALEDYPDTANISYNLATALICEKKFSDAIYEFERAASFDPSRKAAADGAYVKVHGSSEGLDELKQLVRKSALPPAGFSVKTAAQIEAESDAAFEANNPQLGMWKKIKQALAASDGEQYFEAQLKNAAVPQLRGVLVSARPACRPRELLVAVPMGQDADAKQAEILLKLETPLAGQPQAGAELRWEGVPSAFTASPFLLTMDTAAKNVQGLKSAPCGGVHKK